MVRDGPSALLTMRPRRKPPNQRSPPPMTDKQDRLRLQEQIRRTQHKVVDALEGIVDRLSPQPAPARSLAAERRQIANPPTIVDIIGYFASVSRLCRTQTTSSFSASASSP